MYLPSAVAKQSKINAAVSEVIQFLGPDVVHIRYDINQDRSGLARDVFTAWRAISTQDAAQDFLLQLFLPKPPRQ